MKPNGSNHKEKGFLVEPLLVLVGVAVFLAAFLPAYSKAHGHGHGILASIGFGFLFGTVWLVLMVGVLWGVVALAQWSDARKRRRELERERRG